MRHPCTYPVTSKYSIYLKDWNGECVTVTMQGKRESDEDAALILSRINNFPNYRVAGLFDGHNGSNTSIHCAKRLSYFLGKCQSFDAKEIEDACLKLDREIRTTAYGEEGSTGIFVIMEKKSNISDGFRLKVANVGDSRCLLLRSDGTYIKMSEDHKPSLENERKRIEAANGNVTMDRVMGNMAVSRAFGDMCYKNRADLPENAQWIICIPDIKEETALPGDVILLACDGIYEQLSWNDVASYTSQSLKNFSLYETAVRLIDHSLVAGSGDNMTVSFIKLKDVEYIERKVSYNYLPGVVFNHPCYRNMSETQYHIELQDVGLSPREIKKKLCNSSHYGRLLLTRPSADLKFLLENQRKQNWIRVMVSEDMESMSMNEDGDLLYIPFKKRIMGIYKHGENESHEDMEKLKSRKIEERKSNFDALTNGMVNIEKQKDLENETFCDENESNRRGSDLMEQDVYLNEEKSKIIMTDEEKIRSSEEDNDREFYDAAETTAEMLVMYYRS